MFGFLTQRYAIKKFTVLKSFRNLTSSINMNDPVSYLDQKVSQAIDLDLMSDQGGFSIDTLMELAGLSCALAIHNEILPSLPRCKDLVEKKQKNILVVNGPGNNGGDGFVLSRHLKIFGNNVDIFYPNYNKVLSQDSKSSKVATYMNLIKQCKNFDIPIYSDKFDDLLSNSKYDLIIDAIFGFSFKGPIKADSPYNANITAINNSNIPICSIDVPSGMEISTNINNSEVFIKPQFLISLTAPKLCAKYLFLNQDKVNWHYLGGRFVPKFIIDKYNLILPEYKGSSQYVKIK